MDGDMIGVNQTRCGFSHGCKPAKAGNNTSEKVKRMGSFAALLIILPFNFAYAVEFLDPTRPPVEASFSGSVAAVPSGPVLQSVKITPGRRTALISGQLLAEGQRFGEAKLVRITEGEVVLSGPEGRQTLRLFPDVEKHAALPPKGQALKPAKNKLKRKTEQKAP